MDHQEASQQHRDVETDLLAFENRYKEADADRFACFQNTSPQEVHASIVRQQYGKWKPNTKKTFDVFRGLASAKETTMTARKRLRREGHNFSKQSELVISKLVTKTQE